MGVHRGTEQTGAAADKPADRQPNFYQTHTVPAPSPLLETISFWENEAEAEQKTWWNRENVSTPEAPGDCVHVYWAVVPKRYEDVGFSVCLHEEKEGDGVGALGSMRE